MMLLKWRKPERKSSIKNTKRWFANFGLVFASSVIVRLIIPFGLTAVTLYSEQQKIGLFNQLTMPGWLIIIFSLLLLDILTYWQHRLFHQFPLLWCLYRVHHAGAYVDTSTGLRFHPVEIVRSILIKLLSLVCWVFLLLRCLYLKSV